MQYLSKIDEGSIWDVELNETDIEPGQEIAVIVKKAPTYRDIVLTSIEGVNLENTLINLYIDNKPVLSDLYGRLVQDEGHTYFKEGKDGRVKTKRYELRGNYGSNLTGYYVFRGSLTGYFVGKGQQYHLLVKNIGEETIKARNLGAVLNGEILPSKGRII